MSRYRKAMAKAETRAEQLILQDAWLRGTVGRSIPRDGFKEALRTRLAHGTYYDGPEDDGECDSWLLRRFPILCRLARGIKGMAGLPSMRFPGLACVFGLPLVAVLFVTPMGGRETSLSAIAAEMNTTLGSRGSVHYMVEDAYRNDALGVRFVNDWEVWRASGGYAYIESRVSGTGKGSALRFYSTPDTEVLLDDLAKTAEITKYNGRISEQERRAQFELSTPLGTGGGLPGISNLARRPVTLRYLGKEPQAGMDCRAYTGGEGLKVWIDAAGSGYMKAVDNTGATHDPGMTKGAVSGWIHTVTVKPIERDRGIARAVFQPNVPHGYRVIETREVYDSLALAEISLCFKPNLPDDLWRTFEKPKAYAVAFRGPNAVLQMTLFRKDDRFKDSNNALRLSQFRPPPLSVPVNGRVTDADSDPAPVEPEFGTGISLGWVSAGTHMICSAREASETMEPDMAVVHKAIRERAVLLPRM